MAAAIFLTWNPGPAGCTHRVDLRDEASGREWTQYEGARSGCAVPLDLLAESAPLCYRVRALEPKGEFAETLLDYRPLPRSAPDELSDYAGTILIEVPDGAEGHLYRLVVRDGESLELVFVFDQKSEERRFRLQAEDLESGRRYKACLYASNGKGWAPLTPYWEFAGGEEIGHASVNHIVTNLFETLKAGDGAGVPQDILAFTTRDDDDPAYLSRLAAFVFQVWGSLDPDSRMGRNDETGRARKAVRRQERRFSSPANCFRLSGAVD